MNRLRVLTVLFLLGATGFCQTADKSRTTVFTTPPSKPNQQSFCPLEIKATWSGSFVTKPQPVDSRVRQPQSLEITLRNSQSSAVRQTRLTVYGFPSTAILNPAVVYSLGANPLEVRKSFTFDRTIEPGQTASVEVSTPNMVAVTGINLDSLAYADGSGWHPPFRYPCQARGSLRVASSRH
jgi:hypothetical protein